MPYCAISDRAQMSKTINAVRHFGSGGRESLETALNEISVKLVHKIGNISTGILFGSIIFLISKLLNKRRSRNTVTKTFSPRTVLLTQL